MENVLLDGAGIDFDSIFKDDAPQIEQQVTPQEPVVEQEQENPYKDYNDLALAAIHLKEKGLLEVDDVKSLDLPTFASKLEAQRSREAEQLRDMLLKDAGEYRNYFELKLNGIPDEAIEELANDTIISKLKIDLLPEEQSNDSAVQIVERNREKLISEELKYKGIAETEIPIIINGLKDKGLITERAEKSKKFFQDEEDARARLYLEEKARYDAENRRYEEDTVKRINGIIESKTIGDYKMSDDESKKLKSFLSDRNQVVTLQDDSGKKVSYQVTGYDKALYEHQDSAEFQLSFALWLMNGGSFAPIKQQGQIEQHNRLFQEMQRRTAQPGSSSTNTPPAGDDIYELIYGTK